ncbi:agmatine deiminase family protein [Streptococcus suis]|nr:agmatine deiminase family protein [Streptococcus suis]
MFVFDEKNQLHIVDFSFDGWGEKMAYQLDDALPKEVAAARDFDILDVPDFVLEGGSVELDGSGTAMLTRSSVISTNRNPDMSQEEEKAI